MIAQYFGNKTFFPLFSEVKHIKYYPHTILSSRHHSLPYINIED